MYFFHINTIPYLGVKYTTQWQYRDKYTIRLTSRLPYLVSVFVIKDVSYKSQPLFNSLNYLTIVITHHHCTIQRGVWFIALFKLSFVYYVILQS